MKPQIPQGYASLEQILDDEVRWPSTTRLSDLNWYVNAGQFEQPRPVVLAPTSTTPDQIATLADLREGAQRIVEGTVLIRVSYPDEAGSQPVLEPRAFVIARI